MDIPQADLDLLNEKDKNELRSFISNETQRQRVQGRMYNLQPLRSPAPTVLHPYPRPLPRSNSPSCPSIDKSKPTYLPTYHFPLPSPITIISLPLSPPPSICSSHCTSPYFPPVYAHKITNIPPPTQETHALTDSCWKKCVTSPIKTNQLDKTEAVCLADCVERFLDVNLTIMNHVQKITRGGK